MTYLSLPNRKQLIRDNTLSVNILESFLQKADRPVAFSERNASISLSAFPIVMRSVASSKSHISMFESIPLMETGLLPLDTTETTSYAV